MLSVCLAMRHPAVEFVPGCSGDEKKWKQAGQMAWLDRGNCARTFNSCNVLKEALSHGFSWTGSRPPSLRSTRLTSAPPLSPLGPSGSKQRPSFVFPPPSASQLPGNTLSGLQKSLLRLLTKLCVRLRFYMQMLVYLMPYTQQSTKIHFNTENIYYN